MENFEVKIKKMNITSIIFSILFIIIGIFLLIKPEGALHVVAYALGIMLLIWGVVSIIQFFSKKNSQNYLEFSFILGMLVFIFGIIILIKPDTIASIIPLLLGVWMISNGVTKLSYSLTINKEKNATSSMIVSGLIIILGIFLIFNPFAGAKTLTQIIGVMMIIYSLLDLIECIVIKRTVTSVKIEEGTIIEAEYKEKN